MAAVDRGEPMVLGVDGGGSRCAAVLALPGVGGRLDVLGRGVGGTANPRVAGHDVARSSIMAAVHAAFADAGLEDRPAAAACFGLAGVGLAADRDAVLAWATQVRVADRIIVVADGMLPFADAAAEPWGVVLIAGTGSLALARPRSVALTAEAHADRCGGWGPLLGDEGSGYAIALQALKAVMQAADGRGPATILHEAVLRRFAVATGSPTSAAADLAAHVRTLVDRNRFAPGVYPLRVTGGLLTASVTLRRLIVDSLTATGHEPGSVTVVADPAAAAARFAAVHHQEVAGA